MDAKSEFANQGNLFSNRSDYSHYSKDGHILIIDNGGIKSVTNDIENVIADIVECEGDLAGKSCVYRDSMGRWDGIKIKNNKFAGFYPIGGRIRGGCITVA